MTTDRMAAFSDGVIAVIITIMVLEMRPPPGADWAALTKVLPTFLTYVLSFVYVAIYWNNHHHLLSISERVSGFVLWANMHLLFWLSLIPFTTSWVESNHFAPVPTALYGVSFLMPAVAYTLLSRALLRVHGPGSKIATAIGADIKGNVSLVLYVIALALALPVPPAAIALYVTVALIWLIPDRRIERALALDEE